MREWFAAAGFAEVAFEAPGTNSTLMGVGVHRYPGGTAGHSQPVIASGARLFTFTS